MQVTPLLIATGASILTLSGSLAMAATGADVRQAQLIKALEKNGCRMTEETAEKALPPLGFTKDETRAIVDLMEAAGLANVDESGSLILMTENCR
ncbi:hypothetical protein [Paracoccus sulfuroxidans]|uniref:Uncharacterized protein n=1 Tax=Paracoccus sulfuroxidans TaxID=384678 RepID=A0A562NS54_9RHOB|nr:hypothetical protein [Paracoccus sulfuroxidans]TWI35029.1 hypothetical protein IQ24_01538 [Paracoccus sulfuroxidans]